jgi:hypothetical protein
VRLVSSRNREDYQVYTLRKAEQALHCGAPEMASDGLCRDYVRVPVVVDPVVYLAESLSQGSILTSLGSSVEYSMFAKGRVREASSGTEGGAIAMPPKSAIRFLTGNALSRMGLVHADSLISLTCLTNVTFGNTTLCQACFFLDQLLGRIEFGLGWMIGYFTGGQFGDALHVALNFTQYITDDGARVVVGSSPNLLVGTFPNQGGIGADIEYWGDATPNKLRFNDIWALIKGNGTGNSTNTTLPVTLDFHYINGWVGHVIISLFYFFWQFVVDAFSLATGGSGGNITVTFTFLVDWWLLCDWLGGTDYLGTNKRFSVGEVLFGIACIETVTTFVFFATVQLNPINFFFWMVVQFVGVGYVVSAFWVVQTNFSLLCYFGLPVNAVDDALYFLFYTWLPKCEWFWAFFISDPNYDNSNCYPCANADWPILNCPRDLGFGDIVANAVFMLQKYAPGSLSWLLGTRIPPLAVLVAIPYVNARLTAFAQVDLTNPVTYRNYVGCNYIGTLVTNFIIAGCFFYVLWLLAPLGSFVLSLLGNILNLLYRNYVFVADMMLDIQVTSAMAPLIIAGFVDTPVPQHVVEERSMPPPDVSAAFQVPTTTTPTKTRRRFNYGHQPTSERVGTTANLKNILQRTLDNLMGTRKNR